MFSSLRLAFDINTDFNKENVYFSKLFHMPNVNDC